ncbi:hypothetical protein H8959_015664 [Pygathrix nigripes]
MDNMLKAPVGKVENMHGQLRNFSRGGSALVTTVPLPGEQVQVQGVIQTAQSSVIHPPHVQTVSSLSESEESQDSSDSIGSSQKAHGILARRPSYRIKGEKREGHFQLLVSLREKMTMTDCNFQDMNFPVGCKENKIEISEPRNTVTEIKPHWMGAGTQKNFKNNKQKANNKHELVISNVVLTDIRRITMFSFLMSTPIFTLNLEFSGLALKHSQI